MKAIILAAGTSSRLRPLTDNLPKCLLTIGDKNILSRQIEALNSNGISDIIIVVGFEKEKIIDYLKSNFSTSNFTFIENGQFASTAALYSLYLASDYLSEEIIYLNSDLFCDQQIIEKIIVFPKAVTAIRKTDWDEEEVNVITNSKNKIVEIGKHISSDRSNGEFIGATKFDKDFGGKLRKVLDIFSKEKNWNRFAVEAINQTINSLDGEIFALDVTDNWAIEIDTPEDYQEANRILISK